MASRDDLLREHGSMVDTIAHRLRAELELDVDLRDLKNDGITGLLESADRYDEARGIPFGAFAYYRVRGAMVDGLRRMGRLPRRAHDRLKRNAAMYATLELEAELRFERGAPGALVPDAKEPTVEPAGRESLALTLDELLSHVAATFVATAVEQQEGRANPEEALMTELEHAKLRKAIEALSPRERRIVRGAFFEDLRHDELAAELGVERSTITKACTKALSTLRDQLG
jgi:RNA polymerase sigma factor for flagellar operon FliA